MSSSASTSDVRRWWSGDTAFVLGVWAIATIVNLGKAAHVDDGAHLAIAEHILRDPLHPMRGTVFWGAHPEPIHALNQPHLVYYLLALALWISGGSLVVAQLVLAITVVPGVFAMTALGRRVFGEHATTKARLATALVFLGPGFLPGQNLMCDAPLLSLVCVALWGLATGAGAPRRLGIAGLAVGLGGLVKYTALALVPLFALDAWLARSPRRLAALLVPVSFGVLYALFNLADYGGVHVLEREPGGVGEFGVAARLGITAARAALFVLTLGAITLAPAALAGRAVSRAAALALGAAFVLLVVATRLAASFGPVEMRDEPWVVSVLRTVFFLSGVVSIGLAARAIDRGDRVDVLLAASAMLLTAFVVVLSPFVAVRHALLVLPALTLLVLKRADPSTGRALAVGVVSLAMGLTVALSDRAHAAVYRDAARRHAASAPAATTTWFVGHWGWQWYAERAGLRPYEAGVSVLVPGDRLIRPALVDAQPIGPGDLACLEIEAVDVVPAGGTAIARTITSRPGFYAVWQGLPYGPSDEPLETFTIHRVTCTAVGVSP